MRSHVPTERRLRYCGQAAEEFPPAYRRAASSLIEGVILRQSASGRVGPMLPAGSAQRREPIMHWNRGIKQTIAGVAVGAVVAQSAIPVAAAASGDSSTASPIKHVIIIIGENRSFDHVFAT